MNEMVLGLLREALSSRSVDHRVDRLDSLVSCSYYSKETAGEVAAALLIFLSLVDDFTAARAERAYEDFAKQVGYPPLRAAAVGHVISLELLEELAALRFEIAIPGPTAFRE
jgi:hypothetical protein